jgi:hypothetical protein
MRTSHTLLLGLVLLLPSVCHGQPKCAWLNEATARGVLGGPVTMTVNVNERGDGVCEFSRRQGEVLHQLRVSVDTMTDIPKQFPSYLAQCAPTSTPLRAIGNEAVMCSLHRTSEGNTEAGKGDPYIERVVGRVRERAFVVSVSSSAQDDASMTQEMRRAKTNLAAELVAGILF